MSAIVSVPAQEVPVAWRGGEPPLAEVLSDPLIQAVMAADGVDPLELEACLMNVRRGLDGPALPAGTASLPGI